MRFSIYHQIPLWLDFVIFLAILLAALELGYRIGVRRRKTWKEDDGTGGKISLTSMFAVLGLMLAFTFSAAIIRVRNDSVEATIAEMEERLGQDHAIPMD